MVNAPRHLSLICSSIFVNFVFGNINMVNAPRHLSLICSSGLSPHVRRVEIVRYYRSAVWRVEIVRAFIVMKNTGREKK